MTNGRKMRVLLTGASGFIGSHVARELVRRGHTVTGLVRKDTDPWRIRDVSSAIGFIESDLETDVVCDLSEGSPDVCLHLAWYCEAGDYRDSPRNAAWVGSSMKLIQNLSSLGCKRIVIAGSCFEYAPGTGLLAESAAIEPINTYAAAKHSLHILAERYCRAACMSLAWARIFYLYGPAENEKRLAPYVARKLLAGERCPLTKGTQVRDFLHVADVAGALCDIAESEVSGAVNVGSGIPVTVADIATEIGKQVGKPELLDFGAQPQIAGDPPFICADSGRLMRETSWRPKYDLSGGIADAIEWWRERRVESNR